jgi:hypothetical protein
MLDPFKTSNMRVSIVDDLSFSRSIATSSMQLKMKRSNKSIKEIDYCIRAKQGNQDRTNRKERMIFQQSGVCS